MFKNLLQRIAIILLIYQATAEAKDLLHLFRPKPDLPAELNDFLTDVQQHRKDFAFIRNVAKNRRRYENSYDENQPLLGDDNIDSQVTKQPDYEQRFDQTYPKNRYSKFIHSPIRLQREVHPKQRVQVHPNSIYGNLEREEPKLPENKYHTGYLVGIENDDDDDDDVDDDYYQDLRPSDKKKREVEISIRSDGKLVKRIEEDDSVPKSIILNVKSKPLEASNPTPMVADQSTKRSQSNQNIIQAKDVGIPINSISVGNQPEHKNNLNSFDNLNQNPSNLDLDLNSYTNKKEDMEKVEGILMDPTSLTDPKPSEKYMKRQSIEQGHAIESLDYPTNEEEKKFLIPPLHMNQHIHLEPNQTYEMIDQSTHHILIKPVPPTTENVEEERKEQAEAIGEAIAEEILQEETTGTNDEATEQVIEIINPTEEDQKETCEPHNVKEIEIIQDTPGEHKERKRYIQKRGPKSKSKKVVIIKKGGHRHRKHAPPKPKYKQKQKHHHLHLKHRKHRAPYYYEYYYEPREYRSRQLLSANYEFDPLLIQDVGDHEKQEVKNFQKTLGSRKKFKSEGDYADEEDAMTSGTPKQVPTKKTLNQFAMGDSTTEANDDDYDYADLTDMEGEDEDIAYEEEDIKEDDLDIEEPAGKFNKNQHDNNKLALAQLEDRSTEGHKKEDMLLEAKDFIAGAHSHGGGGKKNAKKKKNPSGTTDNSISIQRRRRANWHRKGHKKQKLSIIGADRRKKLPRRLTDGSNQKSLTDREKEDIFLRYNPEFQRWPRFIQSDDMYHELMRRRPLSQKFVKRQGESSTTERTEISSVSEEVSTVSTSSQPEAPAPVATSSTEGEGTSNGTTSVAAEESSPSSIDSTPNLMEAFSVTLPPAAANILETAHSDDNILSTTNTEASTSPQFTSNATDLFERSECSLSVTESVQLCSDESASHMPVTLTTVLPLIPETVTRANINISKDEFLDLGEILDGVLPKQVVSDSFSKAKGFVRQGLKVSDSNINSIRANYNSSAETGLILNEMSNLITKLKYHSSCQVLSPTLMSYLKLITKNPMDDPIRKLKDMDEIDFDEHQNNYVFRTNQEENIHEKAKNLKELMNKFNNLPADCKERAEPVKEYIESHLEMIDHMTQHPQTTNSTKTKTKREINPEDALEIQMMQEGLKNQKPNANDVIKGGDPKFKRAALLERHRVSTSTSPEYGKLTNAVGGLRNRRQVMKRINELLGHAQSELLDGIRGEERGFEAPPVLNL